MCYAWLCIGFTPSNIQLATTLISTRFHNRVLEQSASVGRDMPSLRNFSVDSDISQYDTPDVVAFLTAHGLNLVVLVLNLNVDPPDDVPTIPDICPALTTFAFNADWLINPTGAVSNITKRPHHISPIGLHGLSYALGSHSEHLWEQ